MVSTLMTVYLFRSDDSSCLCGSMSLILDVNEALKVAHILKVCHS